MSKNAASSPRQQRRAVIKKRKALIGFLGILICAACAGVYALMRYQHTSPQRLANACSQDISSLSSTHDADGDGIDDQHDILESALTYINTRPKYKSAYYQGGYPTDGYGVCTDLVAEALRLSGYDLQQLVDTDIRLNPGAYDVASPDSNIDYRRVKNLQVWFARHAIKLSSDPHDIDQWQGGDIVIFKNHIGIVSDHRNADGVPYVIHHQGPWQKAFEEDILEKRSDIVGHYRISQ